MKWECEVGYYLNVCIRFYLIKVRHHDGGTCYMTILRENVTLPTHPSLAPCLVRFVFLDV